MIKSVTFKNFRNLDGKYEFNNTLNVITKEIIIIMTTNINFKNFILKPFLNFNLVIQSPLIHYIIISEYNLSKGIL